MAKKVNVEKILIYRPFKIMNAVVYSECWGHIKRHTYVKHLTEVLCKTSEIPKTSFRGYFYLFKMQTSNVKDN